MAKSEAKSFELKVYKISDNDGCVCGGYMSDERKLCRFSAIDNKKFSWWRYGWIGELLLKLT